ncbi:TetR family transcriptional regulator [Geodermatophilus normandii]|uniref:TetR family transcriptional regulator n=1 Tax=Geodermatophilus normandii TaxID=1137989 RepID=A0A317QLT9_9ACTN|nr:TetR/AcrR family transcriptional regulator [Geodermatophilus normandii]PWW23864.1 TetR family transcriptional regulator [Geodermatophilus normandii]
MAAPLPAPPGGSRGRRARRPSGDDRERAILATAEDLLEQRPLADISVDDLARGAGISRPTFYFYFPSKDAVVLALLDRVVEEAHASRSAALRRAGDDVRASWRAALEAVRSTFAAHPAVVSAVASLLATSAEVRGLWSTVMDGFVEDTAAAIEAERARGAAPDGPPARDLAVALNWMNERVIHVTYAGQTPALPPEDLVDVLLTVWLRTVYGTDRPGTTTR